MYFNWFMQVPQFILDQMIETGRGAECNIIITQVIYKGTKYDQIFVIIITAISYDTRY